MENREYNSEKPGYLKGLRIAGWIILGVITAVFFAFIFGYFVMLLWNWLMPSLFGLATISYWQAFGIIILARLLVGGIGHNHRYNKYDHRKAKDFRRPWFGNPDFKIWRFYESFWKEEGEAAFSRYVDQKNKEQNT